MTPVTVASVARSKRAAERADPSLSYLSLEPQFALSVDRSSTRPSLSFSEPGLDPPQLGRHRTHLPNALSHLVLHLFAQFEVSIYLARSSPRPLLPHHHYSFRHFLYSDFVLLLGIMTHTALLTLRTPPP